MNTKLKTTREVLGLTQSEVATKANIAIRSYQNYESGSRVPSATTAILIAQALNSTVEKLFNYDFTRTTDSAQDAL